MFEHIARGHQPSLPLAPGVEVLTLVSSECGSSAISTGLLRIEADSVLPVHEHECSAAFTVLEGVASVSVQEQFHLLRELDSIHIPARAARSIRNGASEELVLHWALAEPEPRWNFGTHSDRSATSETAEHVVRGGGSHVYELSPGAHFVDLFAGRYGASGICGGYGRFEPGASLPCHIHSYDESITIVEGRARCLVQGARYELSGYDTAFVPRGRPHRFVNDSDRPMAMVWVYAGDEPERTILDAGYCDGTLRWRNERS
jgi:quercetin dioxygenase-like cupin family protein